ncbi:MAG: hypothetical protein Q9172_003484 [Xanthocarpia lactea]
MPGGQSYTTQAPGPGSMPQYPAYQQQPSVMHPGSNSYAPSPGGYGQYGGYNARIFLDGIADAASSK